MSVSEKAEKLVELWRFVNEKKDGLSCDGATFVSKGAAMLAELYQWSDYALKESKSRKMTPEEYLHSHLEEVIGDILSDYLEIPDESYAEQIVRDRIDDEKADFYRD